MSEKAPQIKCIGTVLIAGNKKAVWQQSSHVVLYLTLCYAIDFSKIKKKEIKKKQQQTIRWNTSVEITNSNVIGNIEITVLKIVFCFAIESSQ